MSKDKRGGTWSERYGTKSDPDGSKIKTTSDVPVVGRESKADLVKALNRNPVTHKADGLPGIMDHVDLGPEPIKGTEEQPYLGTDAEYMARERARQADFEKTWGIKHDKKLEETTGVAANPKRVPVTYRQQELPTGDAAKDRSIKKPVVIKREIEVPFGDMELPMTEEEIGIAPASAFREVAQPVRVATEEQEAEAEAAEELEVEAVRESSRAEKKIGR